MLSRNFRLQKVGDLNWLKRHYDFEKIAFSIDELIILDVTREGRNIREFSAAIKEVIRNVFIPVSVGGGIRSMSDAEILLNSGADKVVLNTALYNNNNLIISLIEKYGSQVIIGSIDYQIENEIKNVYIENGETKISENLENYLEKIEHMSIGEIYLNSIQKDGTGQGYDIDSLSSILLKITTPLILAGGAGNSKHLIEAALHPSIDAVATANLFNFIGQSLPVSRKEMQKEGIQLANFSPITF